MPNRLGKETSPYLLQHAENPVDWYPWGPEALERARTENKPILLSIGYAACHWCHVMAHESFEDEETARLMNELFVNIKVDREERPDIDSIYMQAVQAMTGQGGWPMTMFLTPEGVPYYGGTYFPPADRQGMPSFRRILNSVAAAWREQPARVAETVQALKRMYSDSSSAAGAGSEPTPQMLDLAFRALARRFDYANAGFDGAPKFPPTMALEFLLRYWRRSGSDDALKMVRETFLRMARGGIYDQVGGGFARYSVDAQWLVPHFEKMLYDNALLIRLGARLFKATRDAEVGAVTQQTIEWALREMISPEGAFYSSYDADSEGEEGRFYVWSEQELDSLLGADAALVKDYYGVSATGNFEGHNILYRRTSDEVSAARAGVSMDALLAAVGRARETLLQVRGRRVWPGRDDKIIASWNGLMVRALLEAGEAFAAPEYTAAGLRCADFLFARMASVDAHGSLLRVSRTYGRGEARIPGFLEDYAALGLAAIAAHESTLDVTWMQKARALANACVELFGNATGGFFDTASDGERLITRPSDVTDNAIPAGTSLATELLLLLGDYENNVEYTHRASAVIGSLQESITRYPTGFGHLLTAADTLVHGSLQIVLVTPAGAPTDVMAAMHQAAVQPYVPARVLLGGAEGSTQPPLLADKSAMGGAVTAYACRRYLCDAPTTSPTELVQQIDQLLHATHEPSDHA
jgi:uncharacterized protein YyaL (SSP411 family)